MENNTKRITVHSVTRVEGHGNIDVDIEGGVIKKVEWQVPEAPRFFEAFVRGRSYEELAPITSRICGICSIGHTFASLKATEDAMGIKISKQSRHLREILLNAETLQSHILHICYLVLPDLLKVNSVIPLVETHKEAVLLVTKLHRVANDTCDLIGGRTTHPIRTCLGGWTKLPTEEELISLRKRHKEALSGLKTLADLVKSLAGGFPAFERETEYISLTSPVEYAFYDGDIKSSDLKKIIKVPEYKKVVNEYITPQSTAKWAKFNRDAYSATPLARFNNNHRQLTPLSKKVAASVGLKAPCYNPYMNTVVQLVECVHTTETTLQHIDALLKKGLKEEKIKFRVRAGRGVGAVEVPRGVLFHDYTYDKNGRCVKANCVIPTNQNHGNLQKDMEKLVAENRERGKEELQFILEMLVRAYDPCISCSTHLLNVRFI
jgi:sulfhydrogenase subunit alpha